MSGILRSSPTCCQTSFPGHVVLSAKVNHTVSVDIGAEQSGGVGFAMVEARLYSPVRGRAPARVRNDNLVPVSEQRVREHQLTPTRLVDHLLFAVPGRLRA